MPRFGFSKKKKNDNSTSKEFKTFILEPILTPSGLVDGPDEAPDLIADNPFELPDGEDRDLLPELDDSPLSDLDGDLEEIPFATTFDSGTFTVGETGEVEIDFLYDGGAYEGQLAIFSLEGMEEFEPGSEAFVREAARRALSDSEWGHVVIDDAGEGARFEGGLAEGNFNRGDYQGVTTASMRPGDTFGFMLVPDGTVEQVYDEPGIEGSVRPLFSLATANPDDSFHVGQIADVTGDGQTFVFEDAPVENWTDGDYNDIVFQVKGATGEAVALDEVINPDADWRSTEIGQELIDAVSENSASEGDSETGGRGEDLDESSFTPSDSQEGEQGSEVEGNSSPLSVHANDLLSEPLALAQEQLAQFVAQPDFAEQLALAFGEDVTVEQVTALVESLSQGEGLPEIELVPGDELGSRGAFAAETNTIYLSQEFLSQSAENPDAVAEVLLEEVGHYLDAQLNAEDSRGDEGAIFAALVQGEDLDEARLNELRAEDDQATFDLDGQILSVERTGSTGTGLTAQYFDNKDLTNPAVTRLDPTVDFNWQWRSPDSSIGWDTFSGRWTGQVEPLYTEEYTFFTNSDDGIRLLVNGELIINNWTNHGPTEDSGTIVLEAGQLYDIQLEYYEDGYGSIVQLLWESNSQVKEIIPASQLYPGDPLGVVDPPGDALLVPGSSGQTIPTTFSASRVTANFSNEFGLFQVDDADGRIGSLLPGDPGYAEAALDPARRLFVFDGDDTSVTLDLAAGTWVGSYLIQDNTAENFLAQNPDNDLTYGLPNAFFSFTAANPDNFDHVISNGISDRYVELAWEDLDNGGDLDFNDLKVLIDFGNPPSDTEAPLLDAGLANDTGVSDIDFITSDETISGSVTDESQVTNLVAGLNGQPVTSDITSSLAADGSFTLDAAQLEAINGAPLADGTHTLSLQATDEFGNVSETFELTFTLDTETTVSFGLDPASDTSPVGDGQTEEAIVTLVGQTEPNSNVVLVETGATTTADASGNFQFADVSLELGENDFNIQVTDPAGNTSSETQTITRLNADTDPPVIAAALANDTGTSDSDTLTSDYTLTGTVTDTSAVTNFQVRFEGQQSFTDITAQLQADGSFSLSEAQLESVLGSALADGPHTLEFQATDELGNVSEVFELTFILDTETTVSFGLDPAFDSFPFEDGQTEEAVVTLSGQTEANSTVVLVETGATTTADASGNFQFADVSLALGDNSFTVEATDEAGNTSSTAQTITRLEPAPSNEILLEEGSNFTVPWEQAIAIPEQPAVLTFDLLDLSFDVSDPDAINDAFEVALLDAQGNPLVHTLAPNRDAFFNITEGEAPALATGVSFDGQTVSVDLSQIAAGTPATLQLRLVNNDGDTTTSARIDNIELRYNTNPLTSGAVPAVDPSPSTAPLDFATLEDVTPSLAIEYGQTSFNDRDNLLFADIALNNTGNYAARDSLVVVIENISNPNVQVVDADGLTPEGLPYYNFSHLLENGLLAPNSTSDSGTLQFYNPSGEQFTYEVSVFSQLNGAPEIVTQPIVEIIGGQTYTYAVGASDPDGDALSYELLVAPSGMTVDPATGIVQWETTASDIANHAVVLQVTDSQGATALQSFTLSVIETPPNRPPQFVSDPVVDAWIDRPYSYDAEATDADGDPLTYNLILGPEGMTVDPSTGEATWTPQPIFSFGDTVLGQIGLPGEIDRFTFSGAAGGEIYLDPLLFGSPNAENWTFALISPSGREEVRNFSQGQFFQLAETGNYRLEIAANGDLTGKYGFSIIDTRLVSSPPFDETIAGTLSPGSEDKLYRFEGSKGQKLYFDKQLGNSADWDWQLYGPDRQPVPSGPYSTEDSELYLPGDGEYILVLQGRNTLTESADYAFEIVTPDEIVQPLTQLGDNTNPRTLEGEIREKGEVDFYAFDGEAGQRIYLDYLNHTSSDGSHLQVEIFNPDGQRIFSRFSYEGDASAPLTLTEDGTYQVRLDFTPLETTGSYRFNLLDLQSATPVAFDAPIEGVLEPGREAHLYQFDGTEGQRLYLDSTLPAWNARWELYDEGNQLVRNGSSSLGSDLEVVLDKSQTYTLVVRGENNNNAPVSYGFEIVTPETPAVAIAFDSSISGEIAEKGQQNTYTLSGTQGQRLFLDELSSSPGVELALLSPSGQYYYYGSNGSWASASVPIFSSLQDSGNPLVLPESGDYQLIVDGRGEATGNYDLRVVDASSSPLISPDVPLVGTLDPGTSVQFYRFTGQAGDRAYWHNAETAGNGDWVLYDPANQRIDSGSLSGDLEAVLPSDGTYTLMLSGSDSSNPVPYNIELALTQESAVPIALDQAVAGNIAQFGQQNTYTFSGQVGEQIRVEGTQPNGIELTLKSPTGKVLPSNGEAITLVEAGTYQVLLDGTEETAGAYNFTIAQTTIPFTPISQAWQENLTFNTPIDAALGSQETRTYRFDGSVGQTLWFDGIETGGASVNADLYDPSGNLLFANVYLESDRGPIQLEQAGEYYLVLRSNQTAPSNVRFQLFDRSGAEALDLASGSAAVASQFSADADSTRLYRFNGTQGQRLFFDRQQGSGQWRLFAPSGEELGWNFLSSDLSDRPIVLPGDGEYLLALQSDSSPNRDYQFEVFAYPEPTPEPLILGDPVVGSLSQPGQERVYTFTGAAHQRLGFDSLTADDVLRAYLYSPSGEVLWDGISTNDDRLIAPATLKETGTYRLVVDGTIDATGDYNFRVFDFDAAPLEAWDAQSDRIELSGDFGPQGQEVRVHRFSGDSGQQLYLNHLEGNYYYRLYRPDGTLFQQGPAGDWGDAVELPTGGEYALVLTGSGNPGETYRFELGTPPEVTQAYSLGETVTTTIGEAGEKDRYTFAGQPGQKLWFDSLSEGNNFYANARLIAPSGKEVTLYSTSSDSSGVTALEEGGTYTLEFDADTDTTGDVQWRLLDLHAPIQTPLLSWDTQSDPIEVAGDFGANGRQDQTYRVAVEEGEQLYLNHLEGNYTYRLYRPDGTLFQQGPAVDWVDAVELPTEGEYFLVLTGSGNLGETYRFELGTPPEVTQPYSLGETVTTTIGEAGEAERYTFEGQPGQKLWFDSLSEGSNFRFRLIAPNGKEVADYSFGGDSSGVAVLEEGGTYTLEVEGYYDATGDVQWRLLDATQAPRLQQGTDSTFSVSGDFGATGQQTHLYRLTGREGQPLYFENLAGDDAYTLYAPDGQRIIAAPSQEVAALPMDGDYLLAVSGQGTANDPFDLRITASPSTPIPLTLGETQSSAIGTAGEKDTYTFEGTLGQQLFFEELFSDNSHTATLYAPSGRQVFFEFLDGDRLPVTLNETGSYRLVVDGSSEQTGNYSFHLSDRAAAPELAFDTPIAETLAPDAPATLYRFSGDRGQVVEFDLTPPPNGAVEWILYDSESREIWRANGGSQQVVLPLDGDYTLAVTNEGDAAASAQWTVTLPPLPAPILNNINRSGSGSLGDGQPDTYAFSANAGTQIFFRLASNTGNPQGRLINPDGSTTPLNALANGQQTAFLTQTGDYTLEIDGTAGDYAFDLLEMPSNLRGANYLELNSRVAGTLSGAGAKVYAFEGAAGVRLLFNGLQGSDTRATLYKPNGEALFSLEADSDLSELQTLTEDGPYYLAVTGTGDYEFQLLELSTAPDLPYNLPESVTLGGDGEMQAYKLTAEAGQRLFFNTLNGNTSGQWTLYGPGNQPLTIQPLYSDFEQDLTASGDYTLVLESDSGAAPSPYEFQVLAFDPQLADRVTPGSGEGEGSDGSSLGTYWVKLEADDGRGGRAEQEYALRLWPDPENTPPTFSSTPPTRFALDREIYRYQLSALDADGDPLKYRLADGPLGAVLDAETGELLWFHNNSVAAGESVEFTVEATDGRGGTDRQTFSVDLYDRLGSIGGAVFDDLNGNGVRDTQLIQGDNPALLFAIDTSGSTAAPFKGPDGVETVLDAQVAATLAALDSLVAQGLGDTVQVGIIPFGNTADFPDWNPQTPELDYYTTPNADLDGNGIPDVREFLTSLTPRFSTDLNQALSEIATFTNALSAGSTPNVIFLSDGYDAEFDSVQAAADAQALAAQGVNLNAFGVGPYSTIETLSAIDPATRQLLDVTELTDILGGWDPRYAIDPLVEGATVYLDTNNNGQLDEGEPWQVTREDRSESLLNATPFHYHFENLVPDASTDYTLRVVLPEGHTATVPSGGAHTVTIAEGETVPRLFGWYDGSGETQNGSPTFLSEPPQASLNAGDRFIYNALASDPDADLVSYELALAPAGMSVDPETGLVAWTPTAAQVEAEYARLQETRDRLEADGRGDFAPDTVTYNVLLAARDSLGNQTLQSFTVELLEPNRNPSFTSTLAEGVQPQLGKAFAYPATALDADGDDLTYELVDPPAGATIDPNTGLLTWTPQILGAATLTLKASDGKGGEALQTLELEVVEPQENRSPVIASTPRTRSQVGTAYAYRLEASDPDGEVLTYELLAATAGMTLDEDGRLFWTPEAGQMGDHTVTVVVRDPVGAEATQTWTLRISDRDRNSAPAILSTPPQNTHIDRLYRYDLEGVDPDGDPILWGLLAGPEGAVIDPETGRLSWQPTSEQLGKQVFVVRAVDSRGASTVQEFTLQVTGSNLPPKIASVPPTIAGINGEYGYNLVATDSEGEALTYRLNRRPEGMEIDPQTGEIQWTPAAAGRYDVEVEVLDASGGTATQKWTIEVGTAPVNRPPSITSTPVYTARAGQPYSYQIVAADPEGTTPTYELLNVGDLPAGIALSGSGELTWDNPAAGTYSVVVGASDGELGAAQAFILTVRENVAPSITSTPPVSAAPGRTYRYDVIATDPNGDALSYRLENAPAGMEMDELGRVSWPVPDGAAGNYSPEVIVTDAFGGEARQTLNLTVVVDNQAPAVTLQPASPVYVIEDNGQTLYQVDISTQSTLSFRAAATDNVGVESLQVLIGGIPVETDANGIATVLIEDLGPIAAVAIATDTAGNQTQTNLSVQVVDLSVQTDLQLNLDLSNLPDGEVSAPVEIRGTVQDSNGNPVSYRLEAAPIAGGEWTTVFEGSQAVENGVLGTFDPTLLPNDTYTLRLVATDATGASSYVENTVDVTGELKLGNFQLSFTDLEVPVTGIPISVTRTYDSLTAAQQDNFGYGWRLEFRDTNLQTSLPPRTEEQELLGEYPGFRDGTKVYITLPGGKREAFTFQPKLHPEVLKAIRLGAPWPESARFYVPAFVAEDGSELTLSADSHSLLYNANTGTYLSPNGLDYNPAHYIFGGDYTLTTKEGIEYKIDAQSGDLNKVTDLNGNNLTYTEGGILSSSGQEVLFERDAQGRIVAVIDPAGARIEYEYDENGDLVAVLDREGNRTEYFYEESTRPHYLTRIEDPLGREGIRTEYDSETGRLSRLLDVNGEAVQLTYDPENSVQTVADVYGNPTTYVYDSRGNVLTEVDPVGLQTVRTYDERNNVLTETIITAESGPEGWTTTYTYDGENNQLSETDPLGQTTYYTYNKYGQVLTTTDHLGNTAKSDYSPTGKLRSTTDVDGNTTQYTNDLQGNIRAISTSDNTTNFDYYPDGNVKSLEDSLGNKGAYEYTPNGDLEKEVLTIQAPDGTEQEIITEWVYDNEGNLETQIQGDRRVDYDYDGNGNLIGSTTDGQTTSYRYDEKGQLVETVYPDDTPADDSDNPRTITIHDRGGRERATIDQNGNVTHYEYDAVGRLTKTIYPDDTTDQVEQLIAAIAPNETIATIDWTDDIIYPDATPTYVSGNAYTGTEYTQDGRVKAEFDSEGNRTEYQYDPLGRQTEVRTDAENWVEYTYDAAGNRRTETFHAEGTSWTNTYDESGRLVSFADPRNHTTSYEYHPDGQLKAVVDPHQGRTSYEYTEDGQLKSITDALNQTTSYAYDDPEGRLTSVTLPDTTKQSTYTYDDANNTVTVTDFNGDEIKYVYDDAGTLIRKELLASGIIITYNSDDTARTETITRGTESTVYTYDEAGRLTARKDPDGPYTTDDNSIEYVYTDNSMTVKTPSREITTVYNDDGTIQSVTTVHGSETETTSYEYENGQLTKTLFPNGTAEVITYDDLGRIDIIKTIEVDAQGNELATHASYDYEVDAAGNRERVEDHNGRIVTYQYDELNRVTEEKVIADPQNPSEVGRTITYTYDAVGNLDYKADTVAGDTDYVYNSLNQLISSTFGGETTTYTYDSNGSLETRTVGNTVTTYNWENDGENRLKGVAVTENGVSVTTIEYEYNDQGIRVGKTVNGDETRYLIDELQPYAQVIEQYDGETDALEVAYTYGEDLIAQVENGETSYYHVDGLGSTRLLTNEAGVAVETFTYDAYGNLIAGDATAADYLFAGEQRDIETGLDYLRARYYDPTLGRFISRDAYQGTLDDPMSLHKYQYAHANPVVNTDPSGYFSFQEFAAAATIRTTLAGLSFTTGGAVGTLATGGSFSDAIGLYDQFFSGILDALSFGATTNIRRSVFGEESVKNHKGVYFNFGRFAGIIASVWIGSAAATFKTLSSAPWWAKAALGYDLLGAGVGTREILKDGLQWLDILYFLPILAGIGSNLGVQWKIGKKGLSFGLGESADDLRLSPNRGDKLITRGLDAIPDDAINPVLLRSEFLSKYAKGKNPGNKAITVAFASVSEGGEPEYFVAVSGGKNLKATTPSEVTLDNGITYKVIFSDSTKTFPDIPYDGTRTNLNHPEHKLANYIYENYKRNADVNIAVQNVSKSRPGMCPACQQTMPDFAASSPNLKIYIFEGSTNTGP